MHRSFRCLFAASACVLVGAYLPLHAFAQDRLGSAVPKQHWVTGRLADRIRLGDGLRTYHPSRHQLGVRYAPGVSQATPNADVKFVVDRRILRNYLLKLAPLVRRHPVDAHPALLSSDNDHAQQAPARIVPGHDGATLEVDAAVNLIQKEFVKYPDVRHIILPVKTAAAKITAHDLAGITGRIGFFVTRFDPYDVGRTQTVRLATDKVNHTLLQPGQIFSLNQSVGPRNPAHGFFGKGNVFIDGKMAKQYGDGMCQIATTLFNAAMVADLKIVERHQHMRTVPYAVPGSDATVYYGRKDLRFANDTDEPIYVAARTTLFHCIVDIYGKMVPGRKVKIIRHSTQLAHRHVIGSIDRIVYEPDGTVVKGPYFRSDYKWTAALSFHTHSL